MQQFLLPLLLIVSSNVAYHLVTKGTPSTVNPFFSLVVTYLVGAVAAFLLFLATASDRSLAGNFARVNWTSLALGFAIVGLEAGNLFLYRAGCPISLGSLTANIALAVVLLIIGLFFFHESLSIRQMVGMGFCVAGLLLITLK